MLWALHQRGKRILPQQSVAKLAWVGWIEEIPGVNCQHASLEELLVSLRITPS